MVSSQALSGGDDGDEQVLRHATTIDLLDEEALIVEAREPARRRRHFRIRVVAVLIAAACLITIGIVHYTSSSARALTCPSARVKLLDVTEIPGGSGHSGVVVRASVTSPSACTMSGYPILGLKLSKHPPVVAGHMRMAYLGGFENANAPLPRISVTPHSRVVSFTIQWNGFADGDCWNMKVFQIRLPGSRPLLTARSSYEVTFGLVPRLGYYCKDLIVTPLVHGSRGSES
jgi:hypothetical protein